MYEDRHGFFKRQQFYMLKYYRLTTIEIGKLGQVFPEYRYIPDSYHRIKLDFFYLELLGKTAYWLLFPALK